MTRENRRSSLIYILFVLGILIGVDEIATGLLPHTWPAIGKQTWMLPWQRIYTGLAWIAFVLWGFIMVSRQRDAHEEPTRSQMLAIVACFTVFLVFAIARRFGLLNY